MNQEQIGKLEETIREDYGNIAGLVVQKNGETLYESYPLGHAATDPIHVYSVTKSVFSALIGIAIGQGHIQSVDQRIADFFPGHTSALAIRHLLTMTAPYRFDIEPYEAFFESENWVEFALGLLDAETPADKFLYSPIVGAHILAGILARATGRPVLDYATEHLFAPLGISVPGNVALRSREEHISFGEGKNTRGWAVDPQGLNTASWGLCLTARDMAKIGQLYLNDGVWEGKPILPAGWVAESTRQHSRWEEAGLSYGYLWWVIDENQHSCAAMGDGGNVIYVNPAKGLVVAIASLFVPDAKDRMELICGHIEPLL